MSRVRTTDQCRAVKPQAPNDQKIYHCGRRAGHAGAHSAGPRQHWTDKYTAGTKR